MSNPVADIELAMTALAMFKQDLPIFAQGLLDLKQAWTDKSDPTKVAADLVKFLDDNSGLLTQILKFAPAQPK